MSEALQQMACMEVWGGSQLTERAVAFGGLDAWVYSKPVGGAPRGGDIYYASSCASGRITRLLLADVAGHGTPVASVAADLRQLMRRFVNRLDQAEFVRSLNHQFGNLSEQSVFATAIVATFFSTARRLSVCNAGHPRPLLYRAAEQRWDFLAPDDVADAESGAGPRNLPLGILGIAEYDQFDVALDVGDCVLTYTDALIESQDADGEMLGEAGLLRIVRLLGPLDSNALIHAVRAEIQSRHPDNLSNDDVTMMLIRANGREARYSLKERADAFWRFWAALFRGERPPLPDLSLANVGGAVIPALGRRWRARRS